MKDLKSLIQDFDGSNPFPLFYENGYNPDSIKKLIINDFAKYFDDKNNLIKHSINSMSTVWLSYLSLGHESHLVKKLDNIVALLKASLKLDYNKTIQCYVIWSKEIYGTIDKFWSIKNLQVDTSDLPIEDAVESLFQMIGQLIEGLMKPYIKFIYNIDEIVNQKVISNETIDGYDLGKLITDLSNSSNSLLIQPLNVKLNQWRNIAYHHKYIVEKEKIKCVYGKPDKPKELTLNRKKLLEVARIINSFLKILKIAEAIFVFDNLTAIQKLNADSKDKNKKFRDESYLIDFYSAIGSQGFLIKDLVIERGQSLLVVQDLLNEDPIKRGIHSSQFLHGLWLFSKTDITAIEYRQADGKSYLMSRILSKFLKRLENGRFKLENLAKYVEFSFTKDSELSDNLNQLNKIRMELTKKDPFKKHLITAIPSKQQFFSQSGNKLSPKEFIKDFSVGVLINYIVFREIGIKSKEIKINIGSDGSLVVTEGKHHFVSHLSAVIKEKFIQQLIIVCVGDLLKLYERNQLADEIIDSGKKYHDFDKKFVLFNNQVIEGK